MNKSVPVNISGWTCPRPLQNYPTIVLGHGSGGRMMADLIQHLFAASFGNDLLGQMGDSTIIDLLAGAQTSKSGRIAFTTDSFVVSPLFFPGGNIGELSIYGTVNDLAMSGAIPRYLSTGFILEEGLPMETLGMVIESMANACRLSGTKIVAGDTKVVNKGHGDGMYINTSGIGIIPEGVNILASAARPGDAILVNGSIGDHGMAIMSVRAGLEFETTIKSDTAPLSLLTSTMLQASREIHCMRDITRGGLAASLNELAAASKIGIEINEESVPIHPEVAAACEMLGMDAFYIANEGKMVCILPESQAQRMLYAMQSHPLGKEAAIIGKVVDAHPGIVVDHTAIGGKRVVDLPAGELLPRIC